jgi:hypothetical protein
MKLKFGFVKVRYRGLDKNANRLFVTCALVNLFLVRKRLLCSVVQHEAAEPPSGWRAKPRASLVGEPKHGYPKASALRLVTVRLLVQRFLRTDVCNKSTAALRIDACLELEFHLGRLLSPRTHYQSSA